MIIYVQINNSIDLDIYTISPIFTSCIPISQWVQKRPCRDPNDKTSNNEQRCSTGSSSKLATVVANQGRYPRWRPEN